MNPNKTPLENAWDYFVNYGMPPDFKTLKIEIAEEAIDPWRTLPIHENLQNMTRYQEFTVNELLHFAKEKVVAANEGHKLICKVLNADPQFYSGRWEELAEIIGTCIEQGVRAREDLYKFKKAMRELFGAAPNIDEKF